MPNLKEILCLV